MEMSSTHKDVVVDMISRSFADKGDLTTLAEVTYNDLYDQVVILWESLLQANLSFVIIDKSKNQADEIIGACLNFDARSEEAEPLCACAAFSRQNIEIGVDIDDENKENLRKNLSIGDEERPGIKDEIVDNIDLIMNRIIDIDEKKSFNFEEKDEANWRGAEENAEKTECSMSVVEFLQAVEEPLKDEYLPKPLGKTIYTSLLGTSAKLTPGENVKVKITNLICLLLQCLYI